MLPPFKIVTRKRKGDQILHFLWVECAPSCTWVRGGGGGEQTNIGRGSGSIQWFVYGGGVCKGIKVVINMIYLLKLSRIMYICIEVQSLNFGNFESRTD